MRAIRTTWKPPKYEEVEAAMGLDLGKWLAEQNDDHSTSWQELAFTIRERTGQKVSHETLRRWRAMWGEWAPKMKAGA
jgi:hypothetical protein